MKQDYINMKLSDSTATMKDGNVMELIFRKSPLLEMLDKIRENETSAVENYLKLRIRKKPWYIPNFLYKFILSKLVYIQYFNPRS